MKELIVILGSVVFGCVLFDLIAGEDGSLREAAGFQMEQFLGCYGE